MLRVSPLDLSARVHDLLDERQRLQKEIEDRVEALLRERERLIEEVEQLKPNTVGGGGDGDEMTRTGVIFRIENEDDPAVLRRMADMALDALAGSRAVVVFGKPGGRLIIKTRKESGLNAAALFAAAAAAGGGRGGGDERVAQGGGFSVDRVGAIQNAVLNLISRDGSG